MAHLVAATGHPEPLSLREVQSHLGERIARHLVPVAVVEHELLPLTADGRVDRRALRLAEQEPARSSAALAEYVEPRTDAERVVVALLRALLELPRIGVADNIFDLGGHSILVVKLLAQISEVFDADLSLRSVFEAPTAAELAVQIESAIGVDNTREAAEDALLVLGMGTEEVRRTLESTEDAG